MKKTALMFSFACVIGMCCMAAPVTIDPAGSVVVCKDGAFKAAANELALHLKLITGVEIPVADKPGSAYNWFVGVAPEGDAGPFSPEEGRWKATSSAAWFYGNTEQNRLSAAKSGVDMAVYAFLEDALGCRWPWADKISVREQNPVRIATDAGSWKPPFRLRTIRSKPQHAIWRARMRDGRHGLPLYQHAFTGYWKTYGKEHPEYFAMRKDGLRLPPGAPSDRDDPTVYSGNMGRAISMCVSSTALVERVVSEWVRKGAGPFLNVCENDAVGANRCWCRECAALDEPQPPDAHPQRCSWYSDRYVAFGNRVLEKARKVRPDVQVIYYGYNASEIAPRREKVLPGTIIGLVPIYFTPERIEKYIGDWKAAGADGFFYRPNRHHYFKSPGFPLGSEEYFFKVFKQVAAYGPIGFDYDANTKTDVMFYLRDYVIFKGMQDPSKDFAYWENHYCEAFGAAKDDLRDYFRFWRGIWNDKIECKMAEWTKNNPDFGRPLCTNLKKLYTMEDVDRSIAIIDRGLARKGLTANHRALVMELRETLDESRLIVKAAISKSAEDAAALLALRKERGKQLIPFAESYYDDYTGVVKYVYEHRPELLETLPKHVKFYAERRVRERKAREERLKKKPAPAPYVPPLTNETAAEKAERMAWWTDARFGMFIHFGLYAMPARHEWIKKLETIPEAHYHQYFKRFNPDLLDARAWAKAAKKAGMKYAVLTTKHHEGFCLWDSKFTDYKSTNTPFKRDIVREFVDAFRAEGLRVGFYYSLIDWHHPDFTVDVNHPRRPKSAENYGTRGDGIGTYEEINAGRDMARYRKYMLDQVKELLTEYGQIDIAWFDFSYPERERGIGPGKGREDWGSADIVRLVRSLQPQIIIDDRMDLSDVPGGWDFVSPEQVAVVKRPTVNGEYVPWEACQTFSGSWGYHRDETTWKSDETILMLLVGAVSKGGNLILNVGPTGRGEFDARAEEKLDMLGSWMRVNSRSIYGCTIAPDRFKAPEGTRLTWNPKSGRLYVHLFEYPFKRLELDFGKEVEYAQFLHDGSELPVKTGQVGKHSGDERIATYLEIPPARPPVKVPVIEVFLKPGR